MSLSRLVAFVVEFVVVDVVSVVVVLVDVDVAVFVVVVCCCACCCSCCQCVVAAAFMLLLSSLLWLLMLLLLRGGVSETCDCRGAWIVLALYSCRVVDSCWMAWWYAAFCSGSGRVFVSFRRKLSVSFPKRPCASKTMGVTLCGAYLRCL